VVWKNVTPASSLFKRKRGYKPARSWQQASCLAYTLTLKKMEERCFFAMLINFHGLQGIMYQMKELFVTTAVKTTKP
jgi:hypothetical protein